MQEKIGTLLVTGPRGAGKSIVGQLIAELGKNFGMVCMDSSKILDMHIMRKTPVGLELARYIADRNNGKVLPGKPVFTAVQQWMGAVMERQNVRHFIIPGCTRSVEESLCWKVIGTPVHVMHIGADEKHISNYIHERQKRTGIIRPDETEEALHEAIKEHREKVLPSVHVFGTRADHTHRSKPMRERLTETINHGPFPDNIKKRMLNRLNTSSHPVSIEVDKLDGVVPVLLRHKALPIQMGRTRQYAELQIPA